MAPSPSSLSTSQRTLGTSARMRMLFILLIAMFMSLLGVSIVNVALPSMQDALDASSSDIQWVLSGYALTFGVFLVSAGRAGDLFGRGGLFLIGVAIFTAASIAAGLAPDATSLNIARFIQGVGSGMLNPQAVGMIQDHFKGAERGRAFGYFGTAVGLSLAAGPVLGGILIKFGGLDIGWRLTFLINAPFGLIILLLGCFWLPKPLFHKISHHGSQQFGLASLDPVGALLLGLAVLFLLFPFVEYNASWLSWLLCPAGLVLLYAWVKWENYYKNRGKSPMVDLSIFSTPSFSHGSMVMTLYFMGMTSIWVLVALYIQQGRGMTALQSSLFGLPSALMAAYSAHWAGQRVSKYGNRIIILGLIIAIFGLASSSAIIVLAEHDYINIWWLAVTLTFIGTAQGAIVSPNQALTLAEVPIKQAGSSGAIMQTGQRMGTSIGIAVITAGLFITLDRTSWPTATIFSFGAIAFMIALALVVAIKEHLRYTKVNKLKKLQRG